MLNYLVKLCQYSVKQREGGQGDYRAPTSQVEIICDQDGW